MAIDSKHAFIAMEEVVSNNGVKLVVNGIVGRKAVVNAAMIVVENSVSKEV